MNIMAEVTNLKRIRESLKVTQEDVSRRTKNVKLRTYIRAENGENRVRHDTATQILDVINELLKEQGRDPVTLDDLGLRLF
jgi:predicted transcriptional regulator